MAVSRFRIEDQRSRNWYIIAFDGATGDRLVNGLREAGLWVEAAYIQSALRVPADDPRISEFIPGGSE